jgi:dipeptidyl aminopeptidase/acylaminoacyl peptidase
MVAATVAALAVRTLPFTYRTHDGASAKAYLVVPASYGPSRHPPLPLVVSPHGRGVTGRYNLRFWGALPARGDFALVSPDGRGRRLPQYSWGYSGQIADLAQMSGLAQRAFPWLTLDGRTFAIGDSMGGQEVLLLAARRHLAGVAALDSGTDMRLRYRAWSVTPGEMQLPPLGRVEIGGTPAGNPRAYAARSPIDHVAAIVHNRTPIFLWWSKNDRVVTDGAQETGALYLRLHERGATVQQVVGLWQHAHEMHPGTQLPAALACLGLLPFAGVRVPAYRRTSTGIEELAGERVPLTPDFCGRLRR